jgi:arabinofuranosyltransferase
MGRPLSALAAIFFVAVVTRFGWLSDDAFVSFRAASHLVGGHGLVSNVGERVQGFTNPLWTLLTAIPYGLTGNIYGAAMLLSLLSCLGLVMLIWRLHRGGWRSAWMLLLLATSFAFVSFSTSGLENALAHLLLMAFFLVLLEQPRRLTLLWMLGALIAVNRMDHALLVVPSLAFSLFRTRPIPWRRCLLGFSPLLLWFSFALVYYGFPYPNTAYAKLNAAIGRGDLLAQGLTYLVDSLLADIVVIPVILLAMIAGLWRRPWVKAHLPVMLGIALYIFYVCWVGGDFMSGRFFTAPFLMAVLLLSINGENHPQIALVLAAGAVLAGQRMFLPLPSDATTRCPIPPAGVVDERACYVEHTGLAQNVRIQKYRSHPYFVEGGRQQSAQRKVIVSSAVGMGGFAAGPNVHVLDPYGLTEPLLARLRFPANAGWRPGHLPRPLPEGYRESVERLENLVQEPCARALLSDLWLITRGPLFSMARWKAILRRNLGEGTCG